MLFRSDANGFPVPDGTSVSFASSNNSTVAPGTSTTLNGVAGTSATTKVNFIANSANGVSTITAIAGNYVGSTTITVVTTGVVPVTTGLNCGAKVYLATGGTISNSVNFQVASGAILDMADNIVKCDCLINLDWIEQIDVVLDRINQ